jgi:glycosyltransferase involved in cell wall biosynthesis
VPLVSVLLPIRNGASTLERCLSSLFAQTLRDHEVIAVDDGSVDGTGALLEGWQRRESRLRVVHTPPLGLVAALNRAASLARAGVLARMDADDTCAPDRLARQWSRLHERPRVDVLGTCVRMCREGGAGAPGMQAYVEWQNALLDHDAMVADLWVESPLVHPTVMMTAATLRGLGGYRAFEGPEDYDLWLRAERAGLRFGKVDDVLLDWWDGPSRLTRSEPRYAAGRFFELKVEALDVRHLGGRAGVVLWGAGPIGKAWSRALRARGRRVLAFVEVHPRKIGTRVHEAPVLPVGEAASIVGALHLAAVGQPGRRAAIRSAAAAHGIDVRRDMIAVA